MLASLRLQITCHQPLAPTLLNHLVQVPESAAVIGVIVAVVVVLLVVTVIVAAILIAWKVRSMKTSTGIAMQSILCMSVLHGGADVEHVMHLHGLVTHNTQVILVTPRMSLMIRDILHTHFL